MRLEQRGLRLELLGEPEQGVGRGVSGDVLGQPTTLRGLLAKISIMRPTIALRGALGIVAGRTGET